MFSIIIGLIISGFGLYFAFQNQEIVSVRFLENELTGPVSLIIISSMILGFVIGMIIFVPRSIADSWRARSFERENKKLKQRLAEEPIQYEAPGLGEEGEKNIEIVD